MNQEKLTKTERVKLFVTLYNYIFRKTKSLRDKFTIEQLKEIEKTTDCSLTFNKLKFTSID